MSASSSDHADLAKISNTELKSEETALAEPSSLTSGRVNRMAKLFVANKKTTDIAVDTTPVGKKREVDEVNNKLPVKRTAKRAKVDLHLPYNSIKSINMPPRIGYVAGQVPPAPVDGTYPFGNTEDHHNSMIIHWLDEQELTYGAVTFLFNQTFPNVKITEEAVRRRHIRSLERLTKRYGAKTLDEVGPVGRISSDAESLVRHVLATSLLSSTTAHLLLLISQEITLPPVQSTTATPEAPAPIANRFTASYSTLRAKKRKTQKTHEFKKACIVVWKDSLKMDFKAIRNKLEDEYSWSLGLTTIEKYYYQAFDRVYGAPEAVGSGDDDQENVAETRESNAEDNKDSEQLDGRSNGGKDGASSVEDVVAEIEAPELAVTAQDESPIVNI